MKKVVFIQLMMCVSLVAMAQKECKVLSREDGLIRFEVDENLPTPKEQMHFYDSAEQQARSLVSSSVPLGYKPEILAYSFAGEKMALARDFGLQFRWREDGPFSRG